MRRVAILQMRAEQAHSCFTTRVQRTGVPQTQLCRTRPRRQGKHVGPSRPSDRKRRCQWSKGIHATHVGRGYHEACPACACHHDVSCSIHSVALRLSFPVGSLSDTPGTKDQWRPETLRWVQPVLIYCTNVWGPYQSSINPGPTWKESSYYKSWSYEKGFLRNVVRFEAAWAVEASVVKTETVQGSQISSSHQVDI